MSNQTYKNCDTCTAILSQINLLTHLSQYKEGIAHNQLVRELKSDLNLPIGTANNHIYTHLIPRKQVHVIRSGSNSLYLTKPYILLEKTVHFEEHEKYLEELRITKTQILMDTEIPIKFGDEINPIDPNDIHIYLREIEKENFEEIQWDRKKFKSSLELAVPIQLSKGQYFIKSICKYTPTKSYHYTAHIPYPKFSIWLTLLTPPTKTLLFTKTSFEADVFEPKKFTKQGRSYYVEVQNLQPGTYMVDWS